jgi:hypothetical protein
MRIKEADKLFAPVLETYKNRLESNNQIKMVESSLIELESEIGPVELIKIKPDGTLVHCEVKDQ